MAVTSAQVRRSVYHPRPEWNRLGPTVPLWFRQAIKRIDPDLTLQFIPPTTVDCRGVSSDIYPNGIWDVCKRLPRSGFLHPHTVVSLSDSRGRFCQPTPRLVKLLRIAYAFKRRGEIHRMETMVDRSLDEIKKARSAKSMTKLRRAIAEYMSVVGTRQWTNRVYLREGPPNAKEVVS